MDKNISNYNTTTVAIKAAVILITLAAVFVGFNSIKAAVTEALRPSSDFSANFSNCVGSGCSGGHFDVVNESTLNTGDYVSSGIGEYTASEEYEMTNPSAAGEIIVTQVDVAVHAQTMSCRGRGGSPCDALNVNIFIDGSYEEAQQVTLNETANTYTFTFEGGWATADDLRISLERSIEGGGPSHERPDDVRIYQTYADVSYESLPEVRTDPASNIAARDADLNGTVEFSPGNTNAYFRYGTTNPGSCSDSWGTKTPDQTFSYPSNQQFSESISGLQPLTTYYYCAIASNANGADYGDVLSFETERETLFVDLTANPPEGNAPFETYLTASVTGDAIGTVNYSFWWDCDDPTTNVGDAEVACGALPSPASGTCSENENGYKCEAVSEEIQDTPLHTYGEGTSTAKVIAERGATAFPAEDRFIINVSPPLQFNTGGWAWSGNVGWISFSHRNCDSDADGVSDSENFGCTEGEDIPVYGVAMSEDTGEFAGHAWSDRIGWISFNRSETGDPPVDDPGADCDGCIAYLDLNSGIAYGWARALSGMDDPSDGWDGWINLNGTTSGGEPYGVAIDLVSEDICKLTDWSWGDEVMGWTSFSSDSSFHPEPTSEYAVVIESEEIELRPQVFDPLVGVHITDAIKEEANTTPSPQCTTNMQFYWWYFDPGCGDTNLVGYRLQVAENLEDFDTFDDSGETDISGLQFDSGDVLTPDTTRRVIVSTSPIMEKDSGSTSTPNGGGTLGFDTSYYWRIRAIGEESDGSMYDSEWVYQLDESLDPLPFTTPLHPAPSTDFTYVPEPPSQWETTWFTNTTTFNGAGYEDPDDPWQWEFPGGSPNSSTSSGYDPNPIEVVFEEFGFQPMTLTARDGALEDAGSQTNQHPQYGGACTTRMEGELRVQPPLPEFREVTPTSWLDNIRNFFTFGDRIQDVIAFLR